MEKKKLKKLTINKMSGFSAISEQEQMEMKDGETWYSIEQVNQLIDNGTWQGGYVSGMGYVGLSSTVYGLDYEEHVYGYNPGSIGESDLDRYNRMNEHYGSTGGA